MINTNVGADLPLQCQNKSKNDSKYYISGAGEAIDRPCHTSYIYTYGLTNQLIHDTYNFDFFK